MKPHSNIRHEGIIVPWEEMDADFVNPRWIRFVDRFRQLAFNKKDEQFLVSLGIQATQTQVYLSHSFDVFEP
jgi:hypothetical protein